ncbi:phage tail protein [Aggregatibacter kilianii]|uniref:phage tail-collar fiber domain-containing protein n=1 Tax=Aggregatibacter kilianii TaxID=2025884 RepID=UPI000D64CD1F|nr:phage tail protein [Aggregatibacter kilianii]
MASLITPQFEQYIAQQTAAKSTVVFDEFVFANIPGLTADNLKNHLTMPQAAHIVHRQAVSQSGVINENAVVYSVTIGTEVGDFDFNFIGLVNKSKNMLAVAIQTTPVKKTRNKNNVQGNSITRNVLLEFTGAKALTNINVTAQTWQIDFTVRLHGIDEKIRLTNRDLYGRAVFFDDSFLVKRKSGNDYTIEPGVAYVEGVRANMTALETINAANLPCSIYLDVVHHCTVTGAYETELKFLKVSKADYTDTANRPHYVQILADIDRNGVVTDRRLLSPFLGINPLDLDDTTPNKADKRGHTHRLPLASLIKRGIAKLYSGYDSDSEDLAATPKAIKTLKAFIDAITRNLTNYIPNSKKSNAIDSNSADDVATSVAVKTAYDKGVEAKNAADKAQNTAEEANNNANRKVSKSGDWMTGDLVAPHFRAERNHANLAVKSKSYHASSVDFINWDGSHPQVTLEAVDVGGYADELRIWTTPPGTTYAQDRREHTFTLTHGGEIWTKGYGWIRDFFHHGGKDYVFVKEGDNNLAGININRNDGKLARFELFNKQWKFWIEDKYEIWMQDRAGVIAFLDDVRNEKLIWMGAQNGLTIDAGTNSGIMVVMYMYRGRLLTSTISIAHCNGSFIGGIEYGGENADKDYSAVSYVTRNGTHITFERGIEIRKVILLGG